MIKRLKAYTFMTFEDDLYDNVLTNNLLRFQIMVKRLKKFLATDLRLILQLMWRFWEVYVKREW
jgi:hypothetical protein